MSPSPLHCIRFDKFQRWQLNDKNGSGCKYKWKWQVQDGSVVVCLPHPLYSPHRPGKTYKTLDKCENIKKGYMSQVDQANPTKSFREIYPVKPKGAEKKSGKGTEVKHISLFGAISFGLFPEGSAVFAQENCLRRDIVEVIFCESHPISEN